MSKDEFIATKIRCLVVTNVPRQSQSVKEVRQGNNLSCFAENLIKSAIAMPKGFDKTTNPTKCLLCTIGTSVVLPSHSPQCGQVGIPCAWHF